LVGNPSTSSKNDNEYNERIFHALRLSQIKSLSASAQARSSEGF